ncbi:ABC transporter permease [Pengzhenrongella frigida]|uniref:ABC transporter permease n=1 Tax=Pengzhenrongella frigida TaxID=1259133 RepID=A0A4Q5N1Z8_9MICO|nr:ABC transporter permease [Cellulomonas sp. HLT2-17]RYV52096.1 ABC transporter permease [Cellulomonas sp. HLT2-17]
MSGTRVVWMVSQREFKTRMLTKANIISLVVMVVVIAIGAAVGSYFLDRDTEEPVRHVALAREVAELRPALEAAATAGALDLEITTMTADDATATLDGDDTTLDAFLDGESAAPRMLVATEPDTAVLAVVSQAVRDHATAEQIGDLGGDPTSFAAAIAQAVPHLEAVHEPEDSTFDDAAFGVSMAMISILFGALVGSGSMIAMGVVEEKTSRVVEILLSTIRPSQLLAGKVLGIGAYGLFQVLVLGGSLAVAALTLGVDALEIDVSIGSALVWLVVWFLVGYAIFAVLFGGFAALVSRQEDIGSVTTPLLFVLFVPFYTTMFLVPHDPDGTAVRVLSQIPVFAPFMMPVRGAFGALEPWEMPLSLAIAALTLPGLVWLAARVYQRGVLHTGSRMKLREALRS